MARLQIFICYHQGIDMKHTYSLAALALASGFALNAFAQTGAPANSAANDAAPILLAANSVSIEEIRVTSRRREELAQEVPIPVTVVDGTLVADTGGFNVNRIKELIPSIQL